MVSLEEYEGDMSDLDSHKDKNRYLAFDIKLGEKFHIKMRCFTNFKKCVTFFVYIHQYCSLGLYLQWQSMIFQYWVQKY